MGGRGQRGGTARWAREMRDDGVCSRSAAVHLREVARDHYLPHVGAGLHLASVRVRVRVRMRVRVRVRERVRARVRARVRMRVRVRVRVR